METGRPGSWKQRLQQDGTPGGPWWQPTGVDPHGSAGDASCRRVLGGGCLGVLTDEALAAEFQAWVSSPLWNPVSSLYFTYF